MLCDSSDLRFSAREQAQLGLLCHAALPEKTDLPIQCVPAPSACFVALSSPFTADQRRVQPSQAHDMQASLTLSGSCPALRRRMQARKASSCPKVPRMVVRATAEVAEKTVPIEKSG